MMMMVDGESQRLEHMDRTASMHLIRQRVGQPGSIPQPQLQRRRRHVTGTLLPSFPLSQVGLRFDYDKGVTTTGTGCDFEGPHRAPELLGTQSLEAGGGGHTVLDNKVIRFSALGLGWGHWVQVRQPHITTSMSVSLNASLMRHLTFMVIQKEGCGPLSRQVHQPGQRCLDERTALLLGTVPG